MPPIEINGQTVSDVVVNGQEVDEVTANGETVFSAGIPDSGGTNQWNFDAGSGTVVADTIGDLNADFSGSPTWVDGEGGTDDTRLVLNGVDESANLGNDVFESLRTGPDGTVAGWLYLNADDAEGAFIGSEQTTGSTNFAIRVSPAELSDTYVFALALDDDGNQLTGGSPPSNEWIYVGLSVNSDGDVVGYAAEPPDYDVFEVSSDPAPNATENNWSNNVHIGHHPGDGRYLNGSADLSFFDNEGWSESEHQSFVDRSEQFY